MAQNFLRIPVGNAQKAFIRYSPLPRQNFFNPELWPKASLTDMGDGWYQVDLSTLQLADGRYEYDFLVEPSSGAPQPEGIADPYAVEITKYRGYRGIFRISGGQQVLPAFDWSSEPDLRTLPGNHQIVIYELPMRWVDSSKYDKGEGYARQVGLGTFDKALYEQLDAWVNTGINAIELTPVQDSSDTLNWGYGTRFFFAPDYDMGEPYDLKMFILECHKKGIRVMLDIVMNHSRNCPLEALAFDHFYLRDPDEGEKHGYYLTENDKDKNERKDRPDWGGKVFRYANAVNGTWWAREFQYQMARYWISEYHMDGFRIDEFKGINNWDFIREFTNKAHLENVRLFPGRPFLVIAEDSWRRAETTDTARPGGRVVDAIWDFDFQEGLRRLVTNTWGTESGKPSGGRKELVETLLRGNKLWIEGEKKWRDHGFHDMARRIIYPTSHDVEGHLEQRLWGFLMEHATNATGDTSISGSVRNETAMEMQVAAFALTCTAVGTPMFLAGEEFADTHDVPHGDWRIKMSDVVDWYRRELPGHKEVYRRVCELLKLRRTMACLQWNSLEFFSLVNGFHSSFNENKGERVFAFCRPGNQVRGNKNQVMVIANCSATSYASFTIGNWPWGVIPLQEAGGKNQPLPELLANSAALSLNSFQVRVFRS